MCFSSLRHVSNESIGMPLSINWIVCKGYTLIIILISALKGYDGKVATFRQHYYPGTIILSRRRENIQIVIQQALNQSSSIKWVSRASCGQVEGYIHFLHKHSFHVKLTQLLGRAS